MGVGLLEPRIDGGGGSLGAIGTVLGILGTIAFVASGVDPGPLWYGLGVAAIAIPATMAGAGLHRRR